MRKPNLFISWYENAEEKRHGPFYSATPDGFDAFKHEWCAYIVQEESGKFERIIVPFNAGFTAVI